MFTYNDDSDIYVVQLGYPVLIACSRVAAERLRSPTMFCALRTTLATVLTISPIRAGSRDTPCADLPAVRTTVFILLPPADAASEPAHLQMKAHHHMYVLQPYT